MDRRAALIKVRMCIGFSSERMPQWESLIPVRKSTLRIQVSTGFPR